MALKEMRVAVSPEREEVSEPHEMHIVKKYNKFHGHVEMSDGAKHHAPPKESMHEAYKALGEHIGAMEAQPHDEVAEAEAMGHAEEEQA